MPAVSFAQGFGRLGCFFAGCCYGRETDSWFSITFTHSDFAPNGVKLLPTQLMSSAGDFLICGLLLLYAGRKPKEGQVAAGYMVLYGIGRFIIEFSGTTTAEALECFPHHRSFRSGLWQRELCFIW